MGVRTLIDIDQANTLIAQYKVIFKHMEKTKDGISDTTYIGTDLFGKKYILKIYEFADVSMVIHEINLLNSLIELPIPKPISTIDNINYFKGKPIGLYTYLEGESVEFPSINQISNIGVFLGNFHKQTTNIISINQNLYTQKILKEWIDIIDNSAFEKSIKNNFHIRYKLVKDLSMENNCLIHGDLFPDNAKFLSEELTGVFDFIEACNGNSLFDLSVVAISWCFDKEYNLQVKYLNKLIEGYNKYVNVKVDVHKIKRYMMYASLFYATQRFKTKYIEKRDVQIKEYKEYFIKFDKISEIT